MLVYGGAVRSIFDTVPSLLEEESITAERVGKVRDHKTGATYVTIVPGEKDLLKLLGQRRGILGAIEAMAQGDGLTWQNRLPDLTVAYVPESAPRAALGDTIEAVESFLPLPIDLLAADY